MYECCLHIPTGGENGNIKVVSHGHNEPGHGADICDTAGANCIRECWRCTKRTGLSIISAYRTTETLRKAGMRGFIHRQVSHDPEQKIVLPKGTKFKGVKIKSCLHKEYPCDGPYSGGIIFHRLYGMGEGIGITRTECEDMWSKIKLSDHVQIVHDEGVTTTPMAEEASVTTTEAETEGTVTTTMVEEVSTITTTEEFTVCMVS